jgi:hypothetical protein
MTNPIKQWVVNIYFDEQTQQRIIILEHEDNEIDSFWEFDDTPANRVRACRMAITFNTENYDAKLNH